MFEFKKVKHARVSAPLQDSRYPAMYLEVYKQSYNVDNLRREWDGGVGFFLYLRLKKRSVLSYSDWCSLSVLSPKEDQDLLLAAAYVSDAQYNRNVPFETSPRAIR